MPQAVMALKIGRMRQISRCLSLRFFLACLTEPVVLPTTEQAENMVTSGWQASKVFDGAISNDDSTDTGASKKSSGGGGCVYNPNAPARFDMGFILLMVLSAYYLIRRKRRFV
jgi:hypothetical protein